MDIARPVDSSTLRAECPHCGYADSDDFEALDGNELFDARCAHCAQPFVFAVMECDGCGIECYFGWTTPPPEANTARLRCKACYALYCGP